MLSRSRPSDFLKCASRAFLCVCAFHSYLSTSDDSRMIRRRCIRWACELMILFFFSLFFCCLCCYCCCCCSADMQTRIEATAFGVYILAHFSFCWFLFCLNDFFYAICFYSKMHLI